MDLFQIIERVLDKKTKSEEELKQKYAGRVGRISKKVTSLKANYMMIQICHTGG